MVLHKAATARLQSHHMVPLLAAIARLRRPRKVDMVLLQPQRLNRQAIRRRLYLLLVHLDKGRQVRLRCPVDRSPQVLLLQLQPHLIRPHLLLRELE